MIDERQQVMIAVLEGKLPASAITEDELIELESAVMDAVATKRGYLPLNEYALQ